MKGGCFLKAFYNKYFRIPKKDKICETTMLIRIAVMVVIIISCLIAMSVTAYAYYSYNITSSSNNMKSAAFNIKPTTIIANGESISIEETQNGVFTADLQAVKSYNITLERNSESTATTGFCTLTAIKCTEKYYTQQLTASDNSISFNLVLTGNSKITISANWGTSSLYDDFITNGDTDLYIINNDSISLNIQNLLNSSMSAQSSVQTENALSKIISKKNTISENNSQEKSALLGLIQSQNKVDSSITDEEQSESESTEEQKELIKNENPEQDESSETNNLIN